MGNNNGADFSIDFHHVCSIIFQMMHLKQLQTAALATREEHIVKRAIPQRFSTRSLLISEK
jgi:hypothetical protein